MASNNQIIKSRFLPERSFLYYAYPTGVAFKTIDFYFPLLENIEIGESQKPNLATYDLIGRSGNLYAHLGAKSREFSLKFNITLPNVLDYMNNVGLDIKFGDGFEDKSKDVYSLPKKGTNYDFTMEGDVIESDIPFSPYLEGKYYWDTLQPKEPPTINALLNSIGNIQKIGSQRDARILDEFGTSITDIGSMFDYLTGENPDQSKVKSIMQAVDYVILLINVIRTSVINNSSNTGLGPPMIYINHGTMYNNIPCICTNYSIKLNNGAGYELVSFTPRQIEVSMTLSENRIGNFSSFQPFKSLNNIGPNGENLAGWESVIEYGTMDSYLPSL